MIFITDGIIENLVAVFDQWNKLQLFFSAKKVGNTTQR